MPQDRTTGAEGNACGHECGAKIAAALGATKFKPTSNECLLDGQRVVIKCAHKANTKVGVLHDMLKRIVAVIGAFEERDGSYTLLRLPADDYILNMKPTRSQGASAGKVGVVDRDIFYREGSRVRSVRF